MKAFYVGSRDYLQTLLLQETIFDQKIRRQITVRRGESSRPLLPDVTILVEHNRPIYTLGRRDTAEGLPARSNVQVAKTKRGGGITYHGPGQLTVYPIANIQMLWKQCSNAGRPRSPIEWFSAVLESTMMDTAAHYGVPTHPYKTGVWGDAAPDERAEKLGSIGLQLGSWVSMHGAGFNVDPDLRYFDHIVMCELPGECASSLAKEMRRRGIKRAVPTVKEVSSVFLEAFTQRLAQAEGHPVTEPLVDLSADNDWVNTVLRTSGFAPVN